MATGYIGNSENLQQIVITPNKGKSREGYSKLGESSQAQQAEQRLSPAQVRNRSAVQGKEIAATKDGEGFWGEDGFSFGALLDIINPLQHIPIISTVYRSLTGDTIGPGPRMIGGALLGGVAGFAASAVGAVVNAQTGKDIGEHALAALQGGGTNPTAVAQASHPAMGKQVAMLSSADAVKAMPEDFDPPPSAEAVLGTAAAPMGAMDIGKERTIYALGGLENATQRYQQMQMMDRLHTTALGMDIKG